MDRVQVTRDMIEGRTFEINDGYTRTKKPLVKTVRCMTRDEVLALRAGQEVQFISTQGTLRRLKINGQVRRWKRDPDRVEIPIKYGMYETATFDLAQAMERFVVVLGE